jgi:hypothetical protein
VKVNPEPINIEPDPTVALRSLRSFFDLGSSSAKQQNEGAEFGGRDAPSPTGVRFSHCHQVASSSAFVSAVTVVVAVAFAAVGEIPIRRRWAAKQSPAALLLAPHDHVVERRHERAERRTRINFEH